MVGVDGPNGVFLVVLTQLLGREGPDGLEHQDPRFAVVGLRDGDETGVDELGEEVQWISTCQEIAAHRVDSLEVGTSGEHAESAHRRPLVH